MKLAVAVRVGLVRVVKEMRMCILIRAEEHCTCFEIVTCKTGEIKAEGDTGAIKDGLGASMKDGNVDSLRQVLLESTHKAGILETGHHFVGQAAGHCRS
jgi:hypothetical protein